MNQNQNQNTKSKSWPTRLRKRGVAIVLRFLMSALLESNFFLTFTTFPSCLESESRPFLVFSCGSRHPCIPFLFPGLMPQAHNRHARVRIYRVVLPSCLAIRLLSLQRFLVSFCIYCRSFPSLSTSCFPLLSAFIWIHHL
jgi:hypothetical protein